MRFRHPDGTSIALAYCSNVHPAEDLDGVVGQLQRFSHPVRVGLGVPRLGVGLWLAAGLAGRLATDPAALDLLRTALQRLGLEVVTLNGFPYGGFHADVVKLGVYRPDWREQARLDYTVALATVLAGLLPDDVADGSVSTLPLGWRIGWDARATSRARTQLSRLAEALGNLQQRTGRRIRVGLEPEPGCAVETVGQAAEALAGVGGGFLGVCLDACHLAVQFEDVAAAVATLRDAGVEVVKGQLSSGLRITTPSAAATRQLAEPKFLHQVRERTPGGVRGVDDLDHVGQLPGESEWRVHYHVPVDTAAGTTRAQLVDTIAVLVGGPHPVTSHLEVETYTWSVLAGGQAVTADRMLIDGLVRELSWTRDHLTASGLQELVS